MSLVNQFKYKYNERVHDQPLGVGSHLCGGVATLVNPDMVKGATAGSIVEGDLGKMHFMPMYSKAKVWKATMRQSDNKEYSDEIVERGKKYIAAQTKGQTQEWPKQRKHDQEVCVYAFMCMCVRVCCI